MRAPAAEGAGGLFARVAGTDDEHLLRLERVEDRLGQLHCHGADGDAAALDLRLGANQLGHVERLLECLVEQWAGGFAGVGQLVGELELTEDFGLAQHHRVDAARHAEEVLDALRVAVRVKGILRCLADAVEFTDEAAQRLAKRGVVVGGGGVDFHAVAGGENDSLVGNAPLAQLAKRVGDLRVGKGEALPQFDRRGVMAQPCDNDRHDLRDRIVDVGEQVCSPEGEDHESERHDS